MAALLRMTALAAILVVACPAGLAQDPADTADWRTLTVDPAAATVDPAAAAPPATTTAPADGGQVRNLGELPIWPVWDAPTVTWLCILGILALTLRFRRGEYSRLVDGLILGMTCLGLLLRLVPASDLAADGHSWRWWGFLLLSVAAGYWVLRGLFITFGRTPIRYWEASGAAVVLLVAGALLSWNTLRTGTIPKAGIDAFAGGMHVVDTGMLPYGNLSGHDARSPLVYLVTGGYSQLVKPAMAPAVSELSGSASEHLIQVGPEQVSYVDSSLRSLHTLLALLIAVGLVVIGNHFHSTTMGIGLAAVFLLFPGTHEELHNTPILLASTLMTWGVAFWAVPVVSSVLSVLAIVLAGYVWPWSWLALPILMAFSIRRGWSFIGAFLGLLLGFAIIGWTLTRFVEPSLPRYDGIMSVAGGAPRYTAQVQQDPPSLVIAPATDDEGPARTHPLSPAAMWLVQQDAINIAGTFERPGAQRVILPEGVTASTIVYHEIKPLDQAAYDLLQAEYRYDVASAPERVQFAAALRTVLESTWKPRQDTLDFDKSAWQAWGALDPHGPVGFDYLRRALKIVAIFVSLALAVFLLVRREVYASHMAGATAAALAMGLLASISGAGANWIWLLPALLASHAASKVAVLPSAFAVEPPRGAAGTYHVPGGHAGPVARPVPPPMSR